MWASKQRIAIGLAVVMAAFIAATAWSFRWPRLDSVASGGARVALTDRYGTRLAVSYQGWNADDIRPLYAFPKPLVDAFIASEDKRYFDHHGVDWRARGAAIVQNIKAGHVVRGASTITEQVVRMLHPRPRTLWSKWIEGVEATTLEFSASKADILAFYLNEVPYIAGRRGVVQAARYYFDRDITTLNAKERLALAVMVRAPLAFDAARESPRMQSAMQQLASDLRIPYPSDPLHTARPSLDVLAPQFVAYVRAHTSGQAATTLDGVLQDKVTRLLTERVRGLQNKHVRNGAALVVDYTTGEVLAWASVSADNKTSAIDGVTTPRQPGSAMKPLLYAAALDKGWSPATFVDDAPLAEAVGNGLHRFRNYSNHFYGAVTVREALANSLNIPALRAVRYVGVKPYMQDLSDLGITSLTQEASFYDEGLALGNGAITLFELVQAYTALPNGGAIRPLQVVSGVQRAVTPPPQVFTPEATSQITSILSDNWARRLEFGMNSALNMPTPTAVKTGTSTDYRDAWTIAYNDRYVVGVWVGNFDYTPMDGVTGSTGASLVVRSIMRELNEGRHPAALPVRGNVRLVDVCLPDPARPNAPCVPRTELFKLGDVVSLPEIKAAPTRVVITRPTDGLNMALDPRIPRELQKTLFHVEGVDIANAPVTYHLQDVHSGETQTYTSDRGAEYLWPLKRGRFTLTATTADGRPAVDSVTFVVK